MTDRANRIVYLDGKGIKRTFEEELEFIRLTKESVRGPRAVVVVAVVFLEPYSTLDALSIQNEVQSNLESVASDVGIRSVTVHANNVEIP